MSSEWALRKFVAPEFLFGEGAVDLAGRYAKNLGAKKVLLVTDPGVRKAGWVSRVTESFNRLNLPYVIFEDVTENPKVDEVRAGARHLFHWLSVYFDHISFLSNHFLLVDVMFVKNARLVGFPLS